MWSSAAAPLDKQPVARRMAMRVCVWICVSVCIGIGSRQVASQGALRCVKRSDDVTLTLECCCLLIAQRQGAGFRTANQTSFNTKFSNVKRNFKYVKRFFLQSCWYYNLLINENEYKESTEKIVLL